MAEIKIERCRRDDFSTMVKMWEEWCVETSKKNPHFPIKKGASWDFQEILSQMFLDSQQVILVARSDGHLAGFCMGHVEPQSQIMAFEKIGVVENLCVSPENQEVKQALFEGLGEWFKTKGVAVMEVSVFDPGGDTLKTISAIGFKFARAVCQKPLS